MEELEERETMINQTLGKDNFFSVLAKLRYYITFFYLNIFLGMTLFNEGAERVSRLFQPPQNTIEKNFFEIE